jgi:Uncharacterized protein conserved in bacteria (DUF2188)
MPHGDVETYHQDGSWKNRIEGQSGDMESYASRDEAVAAGRDLARELKVEHIIRRLDGTIGERSTYGHDPRDIEG